MDSKKTLKIKTWQPAITVMVFCVMIFGFAAASMAKPSNGFSETENRVLAQRPQIQTETILNGRFETDYEEYLTDQFPLRDDWIGLKTSIERLLLQTESKDIYFADDNYLIEKHTGTFTSRMAQNNISVLAEFARRYEDQFASGHLSVLIIPNAVEILKEKLPPFAAPGGESDYLNTLKEALPDGVWFDAAQVLRSHETEELYYRTDHHWKTLAAFYVYQAWADKQGYTFPELADYEIQTVTDSFEGTIQSKLGIKTAGDTIELFFPKHAISYTVEKESSIGYSIYDYDALDRKDKYAVYFGGNQPFLQIHADNRETQSERKILVIKDSYANCFIPFMLEEFQQIDVLDLRYTNEKLSTLIAEGGYTDLLVLYNAAGFAEDLSITKLTN